MWTEWSSDDPDCPEARRGYGSPTILVNGKDVAPGPHEWQRRSGGGAPRCRLYDSGDGASGVPPEAEVRAAIERVLGPEVG